MKTIAQIEQDILNITMSIHKEFPELSKYINEMPITVSEEKNDVSIKSLTEYYNSLVDILKKYDITHIGINEKLESVKQEFSGYPLYPSSEDIYMQGKKEMQLNPDDLSKNKSHNEEKGSRNEKGFDEDMSGNDLDVPGSELDDQQESVGSEDEENNYYSLGGDNHNDLGENKG